MSFIHPIPSSAIKNHNQSDIITIVSHMSYVDKWCSYMQYAAHKMTSTFNSWYFFHKYSKINIHEVCTSPICVQFIYKKEKVSKLKTGRYPSNRCPHLPFSPFQYWRPIVHEKKTSLYFPCFTIISLKWEALHLNKLESL